MRPSYEKFFFEKEDYKKVCKAFGIGSLIEIFNYDSQGLESSKVFLRTSKGKYVISAYKTKDTSRPKSHQAIMQEISLLELLKMKTPRYIRGRHGHILSYKGYFVTAYNYIEGSCPKVITPKMAYQLGRFIGEFHLRGKDFKTRLVKRRRFYHLPNEVLKRMDTYAKRQKNPVLIKNFSKVRKNVERFRLPKDLEKGPIHVDITPVNELFIGERLAAVLDFGIFYRDSLLIDVGKLIMWNCCKDGKIDKNLFDAAIKGYESKRKLSQKEKKYLNRAILFAIYSHIYCDYYNIPLKIVPESYTLGLVKKFIPVADWVESSFMEKY